MIRNTREEGYLRDEAIIKTIENYKILDIKQLQLLFFNFPSGQRKSQEVLLKLYRKKRLRRDKVGRAYVYFLGYRPRMIEHRLGLNWVRLWFEKRRRSWEKISFKYEDNYCVLRSDGFVVIKNACTDKFGFCFIEFDRGTNYFDKVEKYNALFKSRSYKGSWWGGLTTRFPAILIVTLNKQRMSKIYQLIREQNINKLNFKVRLLDDIKNEVLLAN